MFTFSWSVLVTLAKCSYLFGLKIERVFTAYVIQVCRSEQDIVINFTEY